MVIILCNFFLATSAYSISFQIDGIPKYSSREYSKFLKQLRLLFIDSRNSEVNLTIYADDPEDHTLNLRINFTSRYCLYIVGLNNYWIPDDSLPYNGDNAVITNESIQNAIIEGRDFDGVNIYMLPRVLKILAFIISEAVRFERIEDETRYVLVGSRASINWVDYSTYLRDWGKASKLLARQQSSVPHRGSYYVNVPDVSERLSMLIPYILQMMLAGNSLQ